MVRTLLAGTVRTPPEPPSNGASASELEAQTHHRNCSLQCSFPGETVGICVTSTWGLVYRPPSSA